MYSSSDRGEKIAQFVEATGWSCENAEALLAAHDWKLQPAVAEVLGADTRAHAHLEAEANRRSSNSQDQFDRDLAAALAASTANSGAANNGLTEHEQRQLWQMQEEERRQANKSEPAVASRAPAQKVPADVAEFLDKAGLSAFAQSFISHGYDDMAIIRLMGNDEMDEVGLKGGHKLKLKEALKSERGSSKESSQIGQAQSSGYSAQPAALAPTLQTNPQVAPRTPDAGAEDPDGQPAAAKDSSKKAENILARLSGNKDSKPAQRRYIKDGKITYVDE